jgi:methionyl aminopeptidase
MLLESEVKSGTTKTLLELDKLAETYIRDNGCEPTFLGYRGYSRSVCISINRQLVHGIANDYVLQDGDKISMDLGATYKGTIGDSAITMIYGNPKCDKQVQIIKATEDALNRAIEAIAIGKRLGVIGAAISRFAKEYGFSVIELYGGHSTDIDKDGNGIPHAPPFVSNKSNPDEGIIMTSGLTLCIEPMFTSGSTKTHVDKDGWTVWCDAEYCSHHENTVFIREDGVVEVTTARNC